jgi:ferrous iron transport protein B
MIDEAEQAGVRIDVRELSRLLGIEVIPTIAPEGEGLAALKHALLAPRTGAPLVRYGRVIEERLERLGALLPRHPGWARGLGLMFLAGEPALEAWAERTYGAATLAAIRAIAAESSSRLVQSPEMVILKTRRARVQIIVARHLRQSARSGSRLSETLGRWTREPATGLPIFLVVMFALYYFVGLVGAGVLVGLLEEDLFGGIINPRVVRLFGRIPWPFLQEMFAGEFGLITMGLTYAFALVLPIVGTFFLAFGLLEDSGYLPRLAIMSNRLFRRIGLNGKAILPMVLGLGCDTMATMTTRILGTPKERLIAVLLLALGIPCSAQLATILGILGGVSFAALVTLFGVVLTQMFLVGFLAARAIPGERSDFIMELPPLRLPQFGNILRKTLLRVRWYLGEALPLFLIGTALLFVLSRLGLLTKLTTAAEPVVAGLLGLPRDAAAVFVMGFLRRDYGAAGLFKMSKAGDLDGVQAVVALTVMTLFVPCVANFLMMVKEQGLKAALRILGVVTMIALGTGAVLNAVLRGLHVTF